MSKDLYANVLALQNVKASRLNREFAWLSDDLETLCDLF